MQLFCDLDGVLADFARAYETRFGPWNGSTSVQEDRCWDRIRQLGDFYRTLPRTADCDTLWAYIRPHRPTVLTGRPRSIPEAAGDKHAWVAEHLGKDVRVICCKAQHKRDHANPGDILIDDNPKYRKRWEKMGGIWIAHTNAATTIFRLKAMGL